MRETEDTKAKFGVWSLEFESWDGFDGLTTGFRVLSSGFRVQSSWFWGSPQKRPIK